MENEQLFCLQDKSVEKNELPVEVSTVTAEEFIDIIYNKNQILEDKRFFKSEDGGVFKYFDANDVLSGLKMGGDKFYSFIKTENLVVGICELQKNPYVEKNSYWIKMVSIDEKYQNQGLASKLIAEVIRFAKENNMTLEASSYKDEGYQKLKHILNRQSKEMGVEFIDTEGKI